LIPLLITVIFIIGLIAGFTIGSIAGLTIGSHAGFAIGSNAGSIIDDNRFEGRVFMKNFMRISQRK